MLNLAVRDMRRHVLLVGIDDYAHRPLYGCVNDIDAVQRRILESGLASPQHIRRLVSPHPGAVHDTSVPGSPATLGNLRDALAELGSGLVASGDRVFIYYAGHGARSSLSRSGDAPIHRQALVPVDWHVGPASYRLLYDFELNALLSAIAARTTAVTLVLDCCHAAGVVRSTASSGGGPWNAFDIPEAVDEVRSGSDARTACSNPAPASRRVGSVSSCHVVSAALAHELAGECRGDDGVSRGVFTRALLDALRAIPDDRLDTVTWGEVWDAMTARVRQHRPHQHIVNPGSANRRVFGGPAVDGDPGITVAATDDSYRVAAGALAGITPGAKLAIYGPEPAHFPVLGSTADCAARLGILQVTAAQPAEATAIIVGSGFALPPGARARLVHPGYDARLRCAVTPPDPGLERTLAASPLLELVEPSEQPAVRLERHRDRWFVTDEVYGTGEDRPVLFALHPEDLWCAHHVLEHYHRYVRPLHMAARADPGQIDLRVLVCPERPLAAAEAQLAPLPEAAQCASSTYGLHGGTGICVDVRNRSRDRLRITLLDVAHSGAVLLLGDVLLDAGHGYRFWAGDTLGVPFRFTASPGAPRIERLVALGTTSLAGDLGYLRVPTTFAQAATWRLRDVILHDEAIAAPAIERWVASQVLVAIR